MPARTGIGQSWFRLPINWDMDEDLIGLPEGAKLVFLKIVEFCHTMQSDGTLTTAQLHSVSSRSARGKQSVDRLLAAGALVVDSAKTGGRQTVSIRNAARWLPGNNQEKPISAGHKAKPPASPVNETPRGGARVKRERETEREEERTPSGSVRSSSAQAAPRVAGGATQPAPGGAEVPEVPASGTMSRSAAIASIRETLNQAKQKVPGSTGRDTKFSKYDPDRPMTPINSAMGSGWTGE